MFILVDARCQVLQIKGFSRNFWNPKRQKFKKLLQLWYFLGFLQNKKHVFDLTLDLLNSVFVMEETSKNFYDEQLTNVLLYGSENF